MFLPYVQVRREKCAYAAWTVTPAELFTFIKYSRMLPHNNGCKKNNTPQSHHGLFDLCRGFCCSCCLRAKSLPHNDIIFENNLFLCLSRLLCPLCTRCLRESASLCFVPSEFLCLFRTYSYALIFTTGISFLLSIVCMDFCTSSIFRYRQFPVYFLSILRCPISDSDPVCVNFECFSNRLND